MNTFDVFDTLIARRYITTHEVWRRLAEEFNLPDFVNTRQGPDDGSRSFSQIYDVLVEQGVLSKDIRNVVHDREIELEIEFAFPVQENIDRVKDGDLLISDMYLPPAVILQMVRAAGLNKQVTIYQSNGDKSNGSVWLDLIKDPPGYHLGDNPHSDFNSAKSCGINAELYAGTGRSQTEIYLSNAGLKSLSLLVREVRLRKSNPDNYFIVSNQLNIPLLFVTIEQLKRSIGDDKSITFLGRDCQLMWKLYLEYFGTAYYMPFSRKLAYAQPELAAKYIKSHSPNNSVIVDISSTGETWQHMHSYGEFVVKAAIYIDSIDRPNLPSTFSFLNKNSVCNTQSLLLEIANCADHGYIKSLVSVGNNLLKANFAERELSQQIIESVHLPVNIAISLSKFYKSSICKELQSISNEDLATLFKELSFAISQQNQLAENLGEFFKKEDEYLTDIINMRRAALNKNNQ